MRELRRSYSLLPPGAFERWKGIFKIQSYTTNFYAPEQVVYPNNLNSNLAHVAQRLLSWSSVAILPDAEKEKVKSAVKAIVDKGEGMRWTDEASRLFEIPNNTEVTLFRRK